MKIFLESIEQKDYTLAEQELKKKLSEISVSKLHEMKKAVAAKMTDAESKEDEPLFGKYQKGAREQPNDWVKDVYTGKMKEDKNDSPFEGGDSEKVSNPDAKKENQAKKLAIKAMKKMKEKENIKEEEYLDEVSKEKAARYIKAASLDAIDRAAWGGHEAPPSRSGPYGYKFPHKKVSNRERGIALATDKLTGKAKVPAKEKSDK
jgi:hypothetical protein